MPYRSGGEEQHLTQEGSVVDDLVRQFADPYAFLRELVQNGIDARATRIRVHMDRAEHGAAWSVEDDGVGMTLAIIEGPLLTAFASSKEGDDSAIGKYGVGFLSVFGMAPRTIEVLTHRAEGTWRVTLYPDCSFEVEELPWQEGHGTTVTVVHPVPAGGDGPHEDRGEAALVRWCRHAPVPIELDRPAQAARRTVRIDRPIGFMAPTVVEATEDGMTAWVGPAAGTSRIAGASDSLEGSGAFAGFYNRGLTLVEATSGAHVVRGLRFKVVSSALRHTLSRDDVKHDREHARALALVRRTGEGPMRAALARDLRAAAEEASRSGAFGAFDALLAAAWEHLPREEVVLPVVPGRDGAAALVSAQALAGSSSVLTSRSATGMARELVLRGATIVRLPEGEGLATAALIADLAAMSGRSVRAVETVASRLVPRGPAELGAACADLGEALAGVLGEAGEQVTEVRFADAEGAALEGTSVFVPAHEALPLVALPEHFLAFRDLRGDARALVLIVNAPAIVRAIRAADDDWTVAATLLARIVLLEHRGAIGEQAADALLARAAGEVAR